MLEYRDLIIAESYEELKNLDIDRIIFNSVDTCIWPRYFLYEKSRDPRVQEYSEITTMEAIQYLNKEKIRAYVNYRQTSEEIDSIVDYLKYKL